MFRQIQEELSDKLKKAGVSQLVDFSVPPKPEMGDVAFPCFNIAKEQGKKPNEVASELTMKISVGGVVEKVQAFGPYVNFFLDSDKVAHLIIEDVLKRGNKYGFSEKKQKQKVMVEYSQPNTHKEFHVGHIRNVCIGSSVVSLLRSNGYKTISANYIGDIGAHVAKCLWYIKKNNLLPPAEGRGQWLGKMYAEASQIIVEKPELKNEVAAVQQKLESGDRELNKFWKETKAWSMAGFERIYNELGVKFDKWFFESEVEKPGKKMVSELLEKGVAKKGEGGAIIVDLTNRGLDIFLILKSDGTSLYATKDLALAQLKFKKFSIDKSIYIVDNRQKQYFQQLFATLELLGWKRDMVFLGYEFVTMPGGAMSSRKGNVVLFDTLFSDVEKQFTTETEERHKDWSKAKIADTVKKLSIAAIKFDMLKHPIDKAIVFDIKEATAVEGFSGPYLLYVIARINSLLSKAKKEKIIVTSKKGLASSLEEKKLALMMGESEEVIKKALLNYNPSVIARHAFEVAQAFNDFYNKHSVLNAETKELVGARLALSLAVKQVLTNLLDILTIDTVDEM